MKTTTISYGHTHNLGNYESDRLYMEAQLEGWEDPHQTYLALKKQVREALGAEFDGDPRDKIRQEIVKLNQTIDDRKQELHEIETFVIKQKDKQKEILEHLERLKTIKNFRMVLRQEEGSSFLETRAEGEDFCIDLDSFIGMANDSLKAIEAFFSEQETEDNAVRDPNGKIVGYVNEDDEDDDDDYEDEDDDDDYEDDDYDYYL